MAYTTQAEFIRAFGEAEAIQLTNLDNPGAGVVDADALQKHLDDASGYIDSYLGRRYQLPLPTGIQVLQPCCQDIARYWADRINAREDVRQRFEDWQRWLEQVSKGIVTLGGALPLGEAPMVAASDSGGRVEVGAGLDLTGYGGYGCGHDL